MLAHSCNVNAITDNQNSTVVISSSQPFISQPNSDLQNSISSTLDGMMSQHSLPPSQVIQSVANTSVTDEAASNIVENTFGQTLQRQPIAKIQRTNPYVGVKHNSQKRTCLEALQSSLNNGISDNYCVLDLSNTTDFAQNADLVTQQFFTRIQSAGIKYIYIDLYNASVNDTYISKWSAQLTQSGMQVLWNLSGNKTVSDQTIVLLNNLDNVIGLNIAGTSVTDIGAMQLVTLLNKINPICINFINIYRSKISDTGRAMLEAKFNENRNRWNAIHPDKKINGRGIINDLELSVDKKVSTTQSEVQPKTSVAKFQWGRHLGHSLSSPASPSLNANMQRSNFGTTSGESTAINSTASEISPIIATQTGITPVNTSMLTSSAKPISGFDNTVNPVSTTDITSTNVAPIVSSLSTSSSVPDPEGMLERTIVVE